MLTFFERNAGTREFRMKLDVLEDTLFYRQNVYDCVETLNFVKLRL